MSFFDWLFSCGAKTSGPVDQPPIPGMPPVEDHAPWMLWMKSHVGESEATGEKATPFDIMVFSHTSDDEVQTSGIMAPGCAATVCAALELTGYKSTHRADAASYDNYGTPCELKYGAIVTFKWSGGGRHVTFCDHVIDGSFVACLGGNQGSSLKVSDYMRSRIVSVRWPVKASG